MDSGGRTGRPRAAHRLHPLTHSCPARPTAKDEERPEADPRRALILIIGWIPTCAGEQQALPSAYLSGMEPRVLQPDLFERFPRRPYCAGAKDRRRLIRSRATAMGMPYIQPNAPQVRFWMVYDVDRPQAAMAWEDGGLPPPTLTVARRDRDDSAHLYYGLQVPVRMADPEDASRAMRYAASIELGMTRQLEADLAYTGQLAKTPAHPAWRTLYGLGLYDLGDLAEYVRELPKIPTRREAIRTGIGRNVELFDCTRFWAYRHARDYTRGPFEAWRDAVLERAMLLNADLFCTPLAIAEVRHTAKSIAGWVWKTQRGRENQFVRIQAYRSGRAAAARSSESMSLTAALAEASL